MSTPTTSTTPTSRTTPPAPTGVQRVVLAHGLAALAMAMPWPALLALTWSQSHSQAWLGVVGAARMAPYVALSWAAGALGDRLPRTTVVRISTVVRAVLLAAAAVAVIGDHLATAVVLATLTVVAGTPAYPALAAAMPGTAGSSSEAATGWLVTLEVGAFVAGPALGGLLLSTSGAATAMVAAAATAIVANVLLARIRLHDTTVRAPAARRLAVLRRCPDAVRTITTVTVVNVVLGAVGVALLPLAEQAWDDGAAFGLATAALGFGALAAPVVRRLLPRGRTALRASLLAVAVPLVLVSVAPRWGWALAPLALLGAAATEVECVSTSVLQRAVPDAARAFALGLTDTLMVTGALVGASLAPALTVMVGVRPLFAALAGGAALLLTMATPASTAPGMAARRPVADGSPAPDLRPATTSSFT